MAALITLSHAKEHLNEKSDDRDQDIMRKAEQASAQIVAYLQDHPDAGTWAVGGDIPGQVVSSVLLLLTFLDEHRGDDMSGYETLWNAIEIQLRQLKPGVVA